MLDLIEKISHGFCALLILSVGTLYVWLGTPDTDPPEFLPETIESSQPHRPPSKAGAKGAKDGAKAVATSRSKIQAEDVKLREKLRKNSPRLGGALQRSYMQVQSRTFEYARKEVNWLRELKHIGRKDIAAAAKDGYTRMQITHMPGNSLLRKAVGLRPNDILELVDGERLEIDDESTSRYHDLATTLFDKLDGGGEVSLTITRDGRPKHLVFSLP